MDDSFSVGRYIRLTFNSRMEETRRENWPRKHWPPFTESARETSSWNRAKDMHTHARQCTYIHKRTRIRTHTHTQTQSGEKKERDTLSERLNKDRGHEWNLKCDLQTWNSTRNAVIWFRENFPSYLCTLSLHPRNPILAIFDATVAILIAKVARRVRYSRQAGEQGNPCDPRAKWRSKFLPARDQISRRRSCLSVFRSSDGKHREWESGSE